MLSLSLPSWLLKHVASAFKTHEKSFPLASFSKQISPGFGISRLSSIYWEVTNRENTFETKFFPHCLKENYVNKSQKESLWVTTLHIILASVLPICIMKILIQTTALWELNTLLFTKHMYSKYPTMCWHCSGNKIFLQEMITTVPSCVGDHKYICVFSPFLHLTINVSVLITVFNISTVTFSNNRGWIIINWEN